MTWVMFLRESLPPALGAAMGAFFAMRMLVVPEVRKIKQVVLLQMRRIDTLEVALARIEEIKNR